jgi:hypothetical protein
MDTEQERREVGDAIGLLFRQNAPTDLGLTALTDTAPTEAMIADGVEQATLADMQARLTACEYSARSWREAAEQAWAREAAAQPPLKEEGQDNG